MEPTREEYLMDFRERCHRVKDFEILKQNVINRECPFLECDFERDTEFKTMRRYYRKHIGNGLMDDLLSIIEEVRK